MRIDSSRSLCYLDLNLTILECKSPIMTTEVEKLEFEFNHIGM